MFLSIIKIIRLTLLLKNMHLKNIIVSMKEKKESSRKQDTHSVKTPPKELNFTKLYFIS